MSNKRQITSCPTNMLFVRMLKNRWETNTRLTKVIKNLEDSQFFEEQDLYKIPLDSTKYKKQIEKISRLTIAIKKHEQARSRNLQTAEYISSFLSRTTC